MVKVSIIVPVYNGELYLKRCLNSLVNQTLKEIEILIIDDGSIDDSARIIDQYSKEYSEKVKAFFKDNGGPADARNYGITKAQGEYVAFVDCDDYVEYTMFEILYKKAILGKYGIVDSSYFIEEKVKEVKGKLPLPLNKSQYIERFTACFWKLLISKSLINQVGKIPTKIWAEDIAYILPLVSYAKKIGYVDIPLYHYCIRKDSISKINLNNKIKELILAINYALEYCDNIYKEEVIVQVLKILDRNVLARWRYADIFVKKIREMKELVFSSSMPERYPMLINGLQKYWRLPEGFIKKVFYINGFLSQDYTEKIERIKKIGFYDGAEVIVLNKNNCDINDPIIREYYKKGSYELVAIYFAIQRIIEQGGIYITNSMYIDNPFNVLLPFEAFFAYSGNHLLSQDIFGGKKNSSIFRSILEKIQYILKNNIILNISELFSDSVREKYNITLNGYTMLYESDIALLRPEAVYCYINKEESVGKNSLHFCHTEINNNEKEMVTIPYSLLKYYCENSINK